MHARLITVASSSGCRVRLTFGLISLLLAGVVAAESEHPDHPPRTPLDEMILYPFADTWVDGDLELARTNWNFGAAQFMQIYGKTSAAFAIRSNAVSDALVNFDLAALPASATISNAILRLYWLDNGQGTATNIETTVYVTGALRWWKEGTGQSSPGDIGFRTGATFHWTDGSNSWAGGFINGSTGNFDTTATATRIRLANDNWANTYISFNVTPLVNAWHTGARINYGFVIVCKGSTAGWPQYRIESREGTHQPELVIQYAPPPPPGLTVLVR